MNKNILCALFVAALTVSFVASPAQAGWLEFFFPSLAKQEPSPSETLQAPFAVDPNREAPQAPAGTSLPVNATPLAEPHRSAEAVGEWVQSVLPEILTIASDDYTVDLKKSEAFFDAAGRAEYMAFLNDKGILKVLESQKYYVRSFVQDVPLLMNEGELNGVYHWLFEIPVVITYLDRSMKDYKNNQKKPKSQRGTLTVQVGRSASAANSEGLLVERWSGKLYKIDEK